MKLKSCNGTLFIYDTHLKTQYSFFDCLSNFKIPHHSQYFVMDSYLFEELIFLADENIKKTKSFQSMAEILPRSNITKFEDGMNFPYKFSTIFRKLRRELNKTIVQTLNVEIEEWSA